MNDTYVERATWTPIANQLMSEDIYPQYQFYKDVRVSFTFPPLEVLIKVFNCFPILTHVGGTHKI